MVDHYVRNVGVIIKIRYYQDGEYEVYVVEYDANETPYTKSLFIGGLADCEAFIRLTKDGYL